MSLQDALYEAIPQWDQERIRQAKVLVVGAGALGNEVLKNLALLNVQRIAIMDFDHVEASNLTRSVFFRQADAEAGRYKAEVVAERLMELNPDLQLLVHLGDVVTDLSLGLLRNVDVVIGCVDNRLARLHLNRLCWRAGRPWVDGGILNFSGQVAAYLPGQSCYECGLTAIAWAEIRQRQGCTDMARRYAMAGQASTTPVAASIIGAMQVQEALKLVLGNAPETLAGRMLTYEGQQNLATVYEQKPLRTHCESHFQAWEVHAAPLSAASTVDDVLDYLAHVMGVAEPLVLLDHSVATQLASMQTGRGEEVVLPLPHFSDGLADAFALRHGGQMAVPRGAMVEALRKGDGFGSRQLLDFGVPFGHVLRTGLGPGRHYIGLAADDALLLFEKGIKRLPNPWWKIDPDRIRFQRGAHPTKT